MSDKILRRHNLNENSKAELSIHNAIKEVENLKADKRLTDAVILLLKAKELVSNFVDDIE
jgi:hypothetical protein